MERVTVLGRTIPAGASPVSAGEADGGLTLVTPAIPLMYREPRGSITHPHRDETITLGTLMVRGVQATRVEF
jgi:hypothetical protein